VALVIFTSGLLAIQIFTGAFVLARNKHFGYIFGWLISALATVVFLVLPLEFELRVMLALSIGPVVGIASNIVILLFNQYKEFANDPTT
jgi:hypothetical protein